MKTARPIIRQRRDIVEAALLAGLSAKEIQAIEIEGKKIISSKMVKNDLDEIHTKWLLHDTQWFTRYHISRIETVKRYKQQLQRLNKLLASDGDTLPVTDILGIERLIGFLTKQIYETEKEIDPDMYLKALGAGALTLNANTERSSQHLPRLL